MNFLLGQHGQGSPAGSAPPPPLAPPPSSSNAAFRFRIELGTAASDAVPSTDPVDAQASLQPPAPAQAAPVPVTPPPAPPAAPRYGGAIVRVSELQHSSAADIFASSGLSLRRNKRIARATEPVAQPTRSDPTPPPPSQSEALPNSAPAVPQSQSFPPAAEPLYDLHHADVDTPAPVRRGQKRRRASPQRAHTRANTTTDEPARPTRTRRTTRQAQPAQPLSLRPDGSPHENAWYTKRGKRYFVYDNKTYRGRQAYKMWKQVGEAEAAYRQTRLRTPAPPPSPHVPTPLAPTAMMTELLRTLLGTVAASSRHTSQRARGAVTRAQRSASTSSLPAMVNTRLVKQPVTVPPHLRATLFERRPPASTPAGLLSLFTAAGTTAPNPPRSNGDPGHDAIQMQGGSQQTASTHNSAAPVPQDPPNRPLLPANAPFRTSFFASRDDERDRDTRPPRHGSLRASSPSDSLSSFSSVEFVADPHTDHRGGGGAESTVVTVDGWTYPVEVWKQLKANSSTVAREAAADSTSDASAQSGKKASSAHGAAAAPLAQGGLHIITPQSLNARVATTAQTAQPPPPTAATTATHPVQFAPVADRYESDLAALSGADLDGMFDVAEEPGGRRFR